LKDPLNATMVFMMLIGAPLLLPTPPPPSDEVFWAIVLCEMLICASGLLL